MKMLLLLLQITVVETFYVQKLSLKYTITDTSTKIPNYRKSFQYNDL